MADTPLPPVSPGTPFSPVPPLSSLSPQGGDLLVPANSSRRWMNRGRWLMRCAMLVCGGITLIRIIHGDCEDFTGFYRTGEYVLQHRELPADSELKFYLPSVSVAWALPALLPYRLAAGLWTLLGVASWYGLLRVVRRDVLRDVFPAVREEAVLCAALLTLPLAIDSILIGSFHLLMLWWLTAGLGRVNRGRERSGALLLGAAIWLKLLPAVGVGFLLIRRRWQAAAMAVGFALLLDAGLSLAGLGISAGWRAHQIWWRESATGVTARLLSDPQRVTQQRLSNQAPAAVLRRTVTTMGRWPYRPGRVILADLSARQLRWMYSALMLLLAGCLMVGWSRPVVADALCPADTNWGPHIASVSLAMVWFTPVAPSYHPVAALPALALIFGRRPRSRTAWALALIWMFALLLHAWRPARSLGHMLWLTLAVGVLLWWVHRKNRKNRTFRWPPGWQTGDSPPAGPDITGERHFSLPAPIAATSAVSARPPSAGILSTSRQPPACADTMSLPEPKKPAPKQRQAVAARNGDGVDESAEK